MISISSYLTTNAVTFLHRKYNNIPPEHCIVKFFEKEFNCCLVDNLANISGIGNISFDTPEDETAFILRFS